MPSTTLPFEPRIWENRGPRLTEPTSKPAWFDGKDLAVLFLSGAYLTVFYRYPIFAPDEGLILTPAERILRGQIPYRDFFSEIAPGSFYIQALLLRLGGRDLACVRATIWLLGIVLTWLLYRLGRELLSGPASFVPPLVMAGICYPYIYMISHHWWGELFYFLMLLCLAARGGRAVFENTGTSPPRLFVAGLLAAGAALCVQSVGFFALAAVTLWLLLAGGLTGEGSRRGSWPRGLRQVFWFLLGTGALMGAAVAYFWAHGALGAWAYDNFTFLFMNYRHYETSPGVYSWVRIVRLSHWLAEETSLKTALFFLGYYSFAVAVPAIGFSGALWQLRRPRAAQGQRTSLVLLYLLAGLGSLLAEIHNRDLVHLVRSSPVILILVVLAWYEAFCNWGRWRRPLIFAAGLVLVVVMTAAGMRVAHFASWTSPVDTRRGRIFVNPDSALEIKQRIDAIDRAVPAGGEAFFFPYNANLYFLTATRNPTRYDDLLPGFHSQQQMKEAIAVLQALQPPGYVFSFDAVTIWRPRDHLPDDPPDFDSPGPLERSLRSPQSHYRMVDDVEGMEVWTLKK
jgi:hypothetical protein